MHSITIKGKGFGTAVGSLAKPKYFIEYLTRSRFAIIESQSLEFSKDFPLWSKCLNLIGYSIVKNIRRVQFLFAKDGKKRIDYYKDLLEGPSTAMSEEVQEELRNVR